MRNNFYAVWETGNVKSWAIVSGKNMDSVNDYIIKWFDVLPDSDFSVTTVPVEPDLLATMRNTVPTLYTTKAPSKKALSVMLKQIHLHLSEENMKMGKVPSISLAPGRSCSKEACHTCLIDGCYACKSYKLYPETAEAWDDNTRLALDNLDILNYGISIYLKIRSPRFFRFHVGGDFISKEYCRCCTNIARQFPCTKFLAFTKQFDIVRGIDFPSNFTLRLSDWPGLTVPEDLKKLYHVAWMNDGTRPENTFPADCLECPGNCETCGACWQIDKDTIFHKH